MVYTVSGDLLWTVYNDSGNEVYAAYDYSGNTVFIFDPVIPTVDVDPLPWDMSEGYKSQITSALDYIHDYKLEHMGSFAFAQFNDVHCIFDGNEPNFIDYNEGYKELRRMVFLGDMVNSGLTSELSDAVDYMEGASASVRLVGVGNHEFYNRDANAEIVFRPVNSDTCVYFNNDDLIYYSDDNQYNVRYIMLDYQRPIGSEHILQMDEAEWLASVLETSGNKDIILMGHTDLSPFIMPLLNDDIEHSDTTVLHNGTEVLKPLLLSYIDRGRFSITVDNVPHVHDFSSVSGDIIMLTSGHYHGTGRYFGHGFNTFTCPSLLNGFPRNSGQPRGFTFFLIDKQQKTIQMIICSVDLANYARFTYSYAG